MIKRQSKRQITFEEFLRRFKKVTGSGTQYMARCPAHDDDTPSLSIKKDGNDIRWYCHAGCSQEAVLTAVGLSWADVLPPGESKTFVEPDYYYYRDENGQMLYKKSILRIPGKDKMVWFERYIGEGGLQPGPRKLGQSSRLHGRRAARAFLFRAASTRGRAVEPNRCNTNSP